MCVRIRHLRILFMFTLTTVTQKVVPIMGVA
jgi:hypothetical protein